MIVSSVRAIQREWLEPEDDEAVAPRGARSPAPAPSPAAAASTPSEPTARNLLDTLPAATVQAPTTTAAAPAAATANGTPTSGYTGERPVDAAWLAARETALVAVRADYEAARAQAQANGGTGPGWQPAMLVTDESGQTSSASGALLVHISDPAAPPVQVGWDEGGPVYQQDAGHWLEFNEEAFAGSYRAQGGAPLQALAAQYGGDAATVFAQHPDLWAVATTDHALNAGPPPAGRAMGDPGQLGTLDLYLADPQISALIDAYGGTPAPATGGIALEQVRVYGQARYGRLSQLANAMWSVRDQYTGALAQAQASGGGPGWVERARSVTTSDESGAQTTQPLYVTDDNGQRLLDAAGQPLVATERVFDPDAFTAWYVQQDGAQNKAFGDFYGASHTQYTSDESGRTVASSITFDNPNWSLYGVGGQMSHHELVSINPNDPPDLNNDQAMGFDLEAGWATSQGNLHQDRDWFETVVQIAIVAVVSYVSAGTLGEAAAAAVGGGLGGTVASAAVVGASAAVASGAMSGNLTFKGVLQGALSGALTAGLMSGLSEAVGVTSTAGTIALRTTVQGGIQALLGGSFRDGAIAGFASGLAAAAGASMGKSIDDAVAAGTMSAAEATAARTLARVFTSAVRALGNPNDPNYGFASALVGDLVNQGLDAAAPVATTPPPVTQTAFDDDGNLMPGIVDANASPEEQQAQLAARLERQGLDAQAAQTLAHDALTRSEPGLLPALLAALNDPRTASGHLVTDASHDRALEEVNAEAGINPDADPNLVPAGWVGDAVSGVAGYVSRLVDRTGGALRETLVKVMHAITIDSLEEAQQGIAAYLDGVAARGGLSEIEIMALGTLYAANAAVFPTTVLDVIPGAGKAIGKVGDLIRAGGSVRELAAATRIESRELAEAARSTQLELASSARWGEREALYLGENGQWVRRPAGASDAVYQLGASLERAGVVRPAVDSSAHHLVGFGEADARAQTVLNRFGISPNEAANGVWLTTAEHQMTYGNSYKAWVGNFLEGASSRADVLARLNDIKEIIRQGGAPWRVGG